MNVNTVRFIRRLNILMTNTADKWMVMAENHDLINRFIRVDSAYVLGVIHGGESAGAISAEEKKEFLSVLYMMEDEAVALAFETARESRE